MPRGPKPLHGKLKQTQFYCLGCRKRVTGDDIKIRSVRNYKVGAIPMMKAHCHKCEGKVNKFVKRSQAKSLKQKYA